MAKSKHLEVAAHVAGEVMIALDRLQEVHNTLMGIHTHIKLEDIRYTGVVGHGDLVMSMIQLEALRSWLLLWVKSGEELASTPDSITLHALAKRLADDAKAINDAYCEL